MDLIFRQAGLDSLAQARIDELIIVRAYAAGALIEPTFFTVREGAVEVLDLEAQPIAALTAGDSYGEQLLIDSQRPLHTLRAQTQTTIAIFDGPAYDQFSREYPESAFALQAVLARRLLQELKKAQTNLRLLFETFRAVS